MRRLANPPPQLGGDWNACFERKGLPATRQISDFPEEKDTTLQYWQGAFEGSWHRKEISRADFLTSENPRVKENQKPLSQCHNSCSFNGYCGEFGECRCFYGFQGRDCREPVMDSCFNECSGAWRSRAPARSQRGSGSGGPTRSRCVPSAARLLGENNLG